MAKKFTPGMAASAPFVELNTTTGAKTAKSAPSAVQSGSTFTSGMVVSAGSVARLGTRDMNGLGISAGSAERLEAHSATNRQRQRQRQGCVIEKLRYLNCPG